MRTLMIVIACLAVLLGVWRCFPVVGIGIHGSDFTFHMADEYAYKLLKHSPYRAELDDPSSAYFHDVYITVPAYVVTAMGALITTVVIGVAWTWRRFTSRRKAAA